MTETGASLRKATRFSRLSAKVSFVPPYMAARVTEETSSPTP